MEVRRGTSTTPPMQHMVRDMDRLVELIVSEDKHVLKELLTTDRTIRDYRYVDNVYFMNLEDRRAKGSYFTYLNYLRENKKAGSRVRLAGVHNLYPEDISHFNYFVHHLDLENTLQDRFVGPAVPIYTRRAVGEGKTAEERELIRTNPNERIGILTHPSWLIAHSDAMDNHAIHRGKWIRERLLGGAVPDVPITVDAVLPDEPEETLRRRMRVTHKQECWRCHQKMDPLGLPFEMYNHLGLIRTLEQGEPVDTSGEIIDSGDPRLDGNVGGPLEMLRKLAESERVEQVFVRHVFRFWMGRNETLNDAPVLQAAHRAYRDNGGSMNALLISLLTSDAFLYRTVQRP